MPAFATLDDVDLMGRRVVLRLDLNVPLADGKVADPTRIERVVPTLREIVDKGAVAIVLAHFDRPKGKVVPSMSLKPVADTLGRAVNRPVTFVPTDWRDDAALEAARAARPGAILLMENTRFHPGEEANDPDFARRLADLGDVYVNDAFSAAHRAHASTEGIAHLLPAYAGRAMEAELRALEAALETPRRPLTAIVGGAKVSTKLDLLANLTARVDRLVIGGAMANTFLAARGMPVGRSLSEPDLFAAALKTLAEAEGRGCEVLLPVDARIAGELRPGVASRLAAIDAVAPDSMILDIGPRTVEIVNAALDRSATLVWNGPFGAFETPPFDEGTIAVARHAARLTREGQLASIAGGGDTVAALNKAHAADDFTYVSTAGGAFLEWLEGKTLPGIKVLQSGRQDQRTNRGNQ